MPQPSASPQQVEVAAIILAGGLSRRLGRDKAVEPLGGEALIQRVIRRLSCIAQEIVVVVADEQRAGELPLSPDVRVALDRYPGKGSLGGIYSGLAAASGPWAVAVACDMPFLNLELLRHLLALCPGNDVVVPVLEGRPEVLHALYHKRCLPAMRRRLQKDQLKITGFFEEVAVRYVPEEEVAPLDPELLSFFNINTQEDLDRALALVAQGR